jgi:hypothetical protein
MTIKLNTVFEWCNDISQMRRFYTEGIGLTEQNAQDDKTAGYVVYQAGDTQIVITPGAEASTKRLDEDLGFRRWQAARTSLGNRSRLGLLQGRSSAS